MGISGRDLVLLFGGLFLLYKASHEIFVEGEAHEEKALPASDAATLQAAGRRVFGAVIGQIAVIDIVFSLDSVITAVGMVDSIGVMVAAVITSVGVMLLTAGGRSPQSPLPRKAQAEGAPEAVGQLTRLRARRHFQRHQGRPAPRRAQARLAWPDALQHQAGIDLCADAERLGRLAVHGNQRGTGTAAAPGQHAHQDKAAGHRGGHRRGGRIGGHRAEQTCQCLGIGHGPGGSHGRHRQARRRCG